MIHALILIVAVLLIAWLLATLISKAAGSPAFLPELIWIIAVIVIIVILLGLAGIHV